MEVFRKAILRVFRAARDEKMVIDICISQADPVATD